jgi:hypothetical protein
MRDDLREDERRERPGLDFLIAKPCGHDVTQGVALLLVQPRDPAGQQGKSCSSRSAGSGERKASQRPATASARDSRSGSPLPRSRTLSQSAMATVNAKRRQAASAPAGRFRGSLQAGTGRVIQRPRR